MTGRRPRRYVETEEYGRFARRVVAGYRRRIAGSPTVAADIDNLAALAGLAADVDAAIADAVAGLREHSGYSWTDIGRVLGVTRQAAQQKYGRAAA